LPQEVLEGLVVEPHIRHGYADEGDVTTRSGKQNGAIDRGVDADRLDDEIGGAVVLRQILRENADGCSRLMSQFQLLGRYVYGDHLARAQKPQPLDGEKA